MIGKRILTVAFLSLVACSAAHAAHHTTKWDVRASLQKGWWVAYGREIDSVEYAEFTAAVVASVIAENPAPAREYLQYLVEDSIRQLQKNAKETFSSEMIAYARKLLLKALEDVAKGRKPQPIRIRGIDLDVGIATYRSWETVTYSEPRTRKVKVKGPFGTWTWGFETYFETVTKTIPKPNSHQPYIRMRIR